MNSYSFLYHPPTCARVSLSRGFPASLRFSGNPATDEHTADYLPAPTWGEGDHRRLSRSCSLLVCDRRIVLYAGSTASGVASFAVLAT